MKEVEEDAAALVLTSTGLLADKISPLYPFPPPLPFNKTEEESKEKRYPHFSPSC